MRITDEEQNLEDRMNSHRQFLWSKFILSEGIQNVKTGEYITKGVIEEYIVDNYLDEIPLHLIVDNFIHHQSKEYSCEIETKISIVDRCRTLCSKALYKLIQDIPEDELKNWS